MNGAKIFNIVVIIFFVFINTQCDLAPISAEISKKESSEIYDNDWITIFVHGIIGIKPYLNVPNVVKFVRDRIANSTYARTVELTRRDSFFHQQHPMQGLGLHKVDVSIKKPGATSAAYGYFFNQLYDYADNKQNNAYYTFGWSGLLSPRMRLLEAHIFYNQLLKEFGHYFQQNQQKERPKLRMVCYSHGGNVALKLAEIYKTEGYPKDKKIVVDELILIGVPVLPETDYLINSSLFKKIYHFYSFGDRVQRLDVFSMNRMFSNRTFRERSDFKVPQKKLVQIQVSMKRPAQGKKITVMSDDKKQQAIKKYRHMRTADPGHSELWAFGWIPSSYRHTFPLYPLPFALFSGYLVSQLEKYKLADDHLALEIHPSYEHMIVYNVNTKKESIIPFIKEEQLALLKKQAEDYRPENYTKEIYNARIAQAKKRARQQILAERKARKNGDQKL